MTLAAPAFAQRDPNVQPRDLGVGNGASNKAVWEPAVAAGGGRAVTVFHAPTFGVKYAVYDMVADDWVFEGATDPNSAGLHDPSIAYNSVTGEFVACARTGRAVWTNVFTPSNDPNDPSGSWAGWIRQRRADNDIQGMDKPWIIAGEMSADVQEFYIVLHAPMGYLRTITGGHDDEWAYDKVFLNGNRQLLLPNTAGFAFPAVWQDGEVYACYHEDPGAEQPTIGLLVGEDINPLDPNNFDPNDPNEVGVTWRVMEKQCGLGPLGGQNPVPLKISVNKAKAFGPVLPGGFGASSAPQLVADPTNADRLLLVYHDIEDSESSDVNIYLHELTRDAGKWCASERILVNNDVTQFESDQWAPSMTIDDQGYVHIIFYDDRDFTDPNDPNDGDQQPDSTARATTKYNVYYAWAPVDNLDFSPEQRNLELFASPAETAYDGSLSAFDPHEYNGIAWLGDVVFTTYAGTWEADTQPNESAISSSRIIWHDAP